MLGFEEKQFANKISEWESRVHPDDLHIIADTNSQYRIGIMSHHQREFRMRNVSGQYIWILDRGMVVSRLDDGQPLRIIGTHTDITERKSAEQALTFKEEKYRNIISNMNLGILEMDLEDRIQYANPSFCQLSGYEPGELVGAKAGELFGNHGNTAVSEIEVRNKLGEHLWWLVSGAPSYNDKGERIG